VRNKVQFDNEFAKTSGKKMLLMAEKNIPSFGIKLKVYV
jgi:hypothetical protein